MRVIAASAFVSALLTLPIQADEWVPLPETTSATFAKLPGWVLSGTAAMSWPDGRQALITYWRRCYDESQETCFTQRCIDYFDSDMRQSDSLCHSAQ